MARDGRAGAPPSARAPAAGLDPSEVLQKNPDLLHAVGVASAVFPADRPEAARKLSPEALALLDAFARPRRLRDVLPGADAEDLAALSAWLEAGLLRRVPDPSMPLEPSLAARVQMELWADCARALRARRARDVRAAISRRFELDGLEAVVLDGLFTGEEIQAAYGYLSSRPFVFAESASEATEHIRHGLHELRARTSFLACFSSVLDRLFPDVGAELYRAYCNSTRYGDVAFAHADSDRPSLTLLYYANPVWREEWGGETLFYDGRGEPIVAVAPRPGRLVVFRGEMLHRGGVPSRTCYEPRLSVAVKYWIHPAAPRRVRRRGPS